MVLRMKNINILGFHWKIWLLRGFTKNQYRGERLPKKKGLELLNLSGAWQEIGRECFWGGGWYLNAYYGPKCSQSIRLHGFSNEIFFQSKLRKSGLRTLKFIRSQEWMDGINGECWYKFMQIKRWLKILGVGMVKNGHG